AGFQDIGLRHAGEEGALGWIEHQEQAQDDEGQQAHRDHDFDEGKSGGRVPKSEGRRSKPERRPKPRGNPKSETRGLPRRNARNAENWIYFCILCVLLRRFPTGAALAMQIRPSFGLRVSDFGFKSRVHNGRLEKVPRLKEPVVVLAIRTIGRFVQKVPPDRGAVNLAPAAELSAGQDGPEEGKPNVVKVQLKICYDPVEVGVDTVCPGRIEEVGTVPADVGNDAIIQGEFLHRGIDLGRLLSGGPAHGTEDSYHMVALVSHAAR